MVRRLVSLVGSGLVDDAAVLRFARLLGASFSRIAEAQVGALDEVLARLPETAATPTARVRVDTLIAEGDTTLVDLVGDALTYVWRRHLLAALGRWLDSEGSVTPRAVGFADIAGFTRLARTLDPADLALTIEGFESAAFDVVATYGGRVVKLIGDEVMFVANEFSAALDIALDLIDGMADVAATPSLHCGVAYGPTVDVGGDVFGPTVNLASRLTQIAHRDKVVVPREAITALQARSDLAVRPVRRVYDLKGIGRTPVATIARLNTPAPPERGQLGGRPTGPGDND